MEVRLALVSYYPTLDCNHNANSAQEIAGEIGDVWPVRLFTLRSSPMLTISLKDKAVTIVHRGEMLMNTTYTPKFRKALQDRLAARSVRFVFDDHIDVTETIEGQIKTRKGTVIKADLVVGFKLPFNSVCTSECFPAFYYRMEAQYGIYFQIVGVGRRLR